MRYHFHINRKFFVILTAFYLLCLSLAYGYVYFAQSTPTYFPPCAFKTLFHLYCPGCGGTRAVYYLLRLDLLNSFLCNPGVIFIVFTALYYWCKILFYLIKGGGNAEIRIHFGFLYVFLGIIIVNCIIRNILFTGFDIDYLEKLGTAYEQTL